MRRLAAAGALSVVAACAAMTAFGADATPPAPAGDPVLEATLRTELAAARHAAAGWRSRAVRFRARAVHAERTLRHSPSVSEAISLASLVYGFPARQGRAVAFCESRLDPGARNRTALSGSNATGLFQVLYAADGRRSSTWHTTPFAGADPFSPYASALAAGYIWRRAGGSWREWQDVCAVAGARS